MMKRVRFTEERIAVLREHEAGVKTADLARKRGIWEATLYSWKAEYGGWMCRRPSAKRYLPAGRRHILSGLSETSG